MHITVNGMSLAASGSHVMHIAVNFLASSLRASASLRIDASSLQRLNDFVIILLWRLLFFLFARNLHRTTDEFGVAIMHAEIGGSATF